MQSSSLSKNQNDELILNYLKEIGNKMLKFEKELNNLTKDKEKNTALLERNEILIKKGQMNRAENTIEKWLTQLSGEVIAELTFIDKTTFGFLDCIPKECGIRIVTSNIKDLKKCLIKAEKCSRDRPYFEIIEIKKIHERWIGSKNSFIIEIGTDLKTDALGHSTHTIRKLAPTQYTKSVTQFELFWTKSEIELKKLFGNHFIKLKIFPN